MNMPGFNADVTLCQSNPHYGANGQYARLRTGIIVPAQSRCPPGCYEANVACYGFLMFNTCWCPANGDPSFECPVGDRWVAGPCLGFWENGCRHR